MNAPIALLVATLAGCALVQRAPQRPPLANEGEVLVVSAQREVQPAAVAAVRGDGLETPLELLGSASAGQRALAQGRLEPGAYRQLVLRIGEKTERVEASFSIRAHEATVLQLARRADGSLGATVPPRTLPSLLGFCTASGDHDLDLFDKRAHALTAVLPTGRAPWGVAIDQVQNRAYVALSEDDEVAVYDVAASTELKRIRLSAGDAPRELLLSADRRTLITANSGSNTVSLIDANSALETARINVGEQPTALVADRKTPRVYVFNARSNNISVVDTASRAVVSTLPFEGPPLRGQLDKQGTHLYVASPLSNDLLVYSLPDFAQAKRVHIGLGTTALKVDPATDLLYVAQADGRLALYDPFALIPVDFIDLPGVASWLAIDGAENSLLALMPERRSVAVINLATKELLGELDVGQDPRVLALYGERN